MPEFISGGQDIKIVVENFGQVASKPAVLKLEQLQDGNRKEIGQAKVAALTPYGKTNATLSTKTKFEKGKAYDFLLTIRTSDNVVSTYSFQTSPVK